MKKQVFAALLLFCGAAQAQSNIHFTSQEVTSIVAGNYNPADYPFSGTILNPHQLVKNLNEQINADSLKAYIVKLGSFGNRNTGADTISTTFGIGAARSWTLSKFQQFSQQPNSRLKTSYLQFDQTICAVNRHKDICAVLPGSDTSNHQLIIVEGHIDSRCSDVCDSLCLAEGIEDNASGTALVLELARVMSRYQYKNTILFVLTIGEEQGLYGANALAQYAKDNTLPVKAVFNNDVIGGIICGQTSSSPSCPGLNDIDSLQVRFFTFGGFNSKHKQLARFTKLEYKEELLPWVKVPMTLSIMTNEDRIGRGGDHIPFRQKGFSSMRFTSANEHGDASNSVGYTDRQHTSEDVLGVDTNLDGTIDSFFVDFNYLARNGAINAASIAMAAIGPNEPDFTVDGQFGPALVINITKETQYATYRVGLRSLTNDWDSVYTISGTSGIIYPPQAANYYVSVASVDDQGVESLFSREIVISQSQIGLEETQRENTGFELLQNKPNPFDEATIIGVQVNSQFAYKTAQIEIRNVEGKLIEKLDLQLEKGINEVVYNHGYGKTGIYSYSLIIDGEIRAVKQMIFAN